jgi:hypothetical protein
MIARSQAHLVTAKGAEVYRFDLGWVPVAR